LRELSPVRGEAKSVHCLQTGSKNNQKARIVVSGNSQGFGKLRREKQVSHVTSQLRALKALYPRCFVFVFVFTMGTS
jgi:hypothetical protein